MPVTERIISEEEKIIKIVTKEFVCSDGAVFKNDLWAAENHESRLEHLEKWKDYADDLIDNPLLDTGISFGSDYAYGFKAIDVIEALKKLVDKYGDDVYVEQCFDNEELNISYKKET